MVTNAASGLVSLLVIKLECGKWRLPFLVSALFGVNILFHSYERTLKCIGIYGVFDVLYI